MSKDNTECGFCGKNFKSVAHKMAHQKKECEKMPRTNTEKPEE